MIDKREKKTALEIETQKGKKKKKAKQTETDPAARRKYSHTNKHGDSHAGGDKQAAETKKTFAKRKEKIQREKITDKHRPRYRQVKGQTVKDRKAK